MNWIDEKEIGKLKGVIAQCEDTARFEKIESGTESYFKDILSRDEDFAEIRFNSIEELKSKICSHSQKCDEKIVHELAVLYYKTLFYDDIKREKIISKKNDDLSIPDYIYAF